MEGSRRNVYRGIPWALSLLLVASCRDLDSLVETSRPEAHAACATTPNLRYYGGPVIQNVKIYAVNWGPNVSSNIAAALPSFYSAIVASPYLDWLSEYNTVGLDGVVDDQPGTNQGISRGSFAGSVTITPALCAGTTACTVTDAQLRDELAAQFAAGTLAAPTQGCDGQSDTLYMLNFNAAVTVQKRAGLGTCMPLCYYHGTASYAGKPFAYAVLPDVSAPGCNGTCGAGPLAIDNQTSIASRAMVEAIVDPDVDLATNFARPLGWYDDGCGEIGAICDGLVGTIAVAGTTFAVQRQWSNALADCIVSKSALPPICASPDAGAGCRSCACADDGQTASGQVGCSGAAPRCETAGANLKFGLCVACTEGAQCPSGTCTKSAELSTDDTCAAAGGGDGAAGADGSTDGGGSGPDGGGGGSGGGCHCELDAHGAGPTARDLALALGALLVTARRRRRPTRPAARL